MDLIDKEISKHALEGFGWNLGEYNQSTPVSSHFVFFRDWRFKKTWLVSLSQNDFNNTRVTTKVNFEGVVAGVATIINKIVRNQRLSSDENEAYAPLLTNYIKQTQCFQAWRRQVSSDQRLHLIINVYADSKFNKDAVKFRPFIINADGVILSSAEVEEYTAHVQRGDKQKHPEWFS